MVNRQRASLRCYLGRCHRCRWFLRHPCPSRRSLLGVSFPALASIGSVRLVYWRKSQVICAEVYRSAAFDAGQKAWFLPDLLERPWLSSLAEIASDLRGSLSKRCNGRPAKSVLFAGEST